MLTKSIKITVILLIISSNLCIGQTDAKKAAGPTLLTADSLASGNYKDVLSSFFQLAVRNLTGPDKDFHFAANPFAIMLRNDGSLAENKNYLKPINRFWRKLNFDLDAKLDSIYNFNGFSIGIKYNLLNNRDFSMSKAFEKLIKSDSNDQQYKDLMIATSKHVFEDLKQHNIDSAKYHLLIDQLSKASNDSTFTFDKIDTSLSEIIKKIALDSNYSYFLSAVQKNPKLNVFSERNKGYRNIVNSFQKKPLLTIGVNDTSYNNGNLFKSMNFSSEFLVATGGSNNIVNAELDFKVSLNLTDDTLIAGKNLHRQIFNFEPGINFVLNGKKNHQPYLEFKLSGGYSNVWKKGTLYKNEEQITNSINGTIRIRIFNEIWVPLQFKYDIKNHNVFGFLNVTTNFTGLGSLLKGSSSSKAQ